VPDHARADRGDGDQPARRAGDAVVPEEQALQQDDAEADRAEGQQQGEIASGALLGAGRLLREHGPEDRVEQQAEAVEAEQEHERDADRRDRDAEMPRYTGRDTGDDTVLTRPVEAARRWCGGGSDRSSSRLPARCCPASSIVTRGGGPGPRGKSPIPATPGSQGGVRVAA
jgi:hypothetical protein